MRSNRISHLLVALFIASAATLAAAPVAAQSPYDGLWQVTVVTKSGSCDAQTTSTVNVSDGKISGGPPYFSLLFGVLMAPIVLLLPFGPLIRWQRRCRISLLARNGPCFCS